ncbi:MAG: Gfo/Idh/MocA family oxidoreductase [Planctomycetota bacterium]
MAATRVALIGYQFMGKVHSHAYRTVAHFFPEIEKPEMKVLCGRNESAVKSAAAQYGWQEHATSWVDVLKRDDIDLVDVSTPGDSHRPIAIAAAQAGKAVFCEKPLANTLTEAKEMLAAVEEAKVPNMVAFNYRRVPAISFARQLIQSGRLGRIYHFRARYLQDWIMDPEFPLVWRLQADKAGSGPHGDLNAHIVDVARYLVGEITSVSGLTETFIKERPLPDGKGRGKVTVDDAALFLARFESGAVGSFEATRFAGGRKNHMTFEINGEKASLSFNLERLNELELWDAEDGTTQGFRDILVTEGDHPYIAAWWPPGHIIGYEHTFTHEVRDLLECLQTGQTPAPSFRDGVACQAVLEAVLDSVAKKSWVEVPKLG